MTILDTVAVDPADLPAGVMLEDVEPESVEWLWYGRIPLGKITVLDGDPGLGKSTLSLDVAARVSRGVPLPGDELRIGAAGVVLLSAEDDLADTIRPRLDAAGADVSRIVALREVLDGDEWRPPTLPDDIAWVRSAIDRVDARVVIIDPLMAYLSGGIDAHKDQQVRRGLHRLAILAEETGVAIILVRHLNKAPGGNPLYRGGGSIGIVGAARSGLLVGRDPGDDTRRVLASTKCNLAPPVASIAFHLETIGDTSRVAYDGESTFSAQSILAEPVGDDERSAQDEAVMFVKDVLAAGAMSAKDIKKLAREAGIADRTLDRAKRKAGVVSTQLGFHQGWIWELPTDDHASDTRRPGDLASCEVGDLCHRTPTERQNATKPLSLLDGDLWRPVGTLPAALPEGETHV